MELIETIIYILVFLLSMIVATVISEEIPHNGGTD